MNIYHLNHSDIEGGAARAAYRIHQSLRRSGENSTMMVNVAKVPDWTVCGPASKLRTVANKLRPVIGGFLVQTLGTGNTNLHSPAILPSGWPRRINTSNADVVNLHWINGEMMSIGDVAKIRKPLVWTLHDMWTFCGAEHYTNDYRWRDGYKDGNRPAYERGLDLNRLTWSRKLRHWKRPIHIIAPSAWLAECVKSAGLMQDWPVSIVPYALDIDLWKPVDRSLARELLGLPLDVPLLLFGAIGGTSDPRKGFDLLQCALKNLSNGPQDLELVILGQGEPNAQPDLGFPLHYTGHLHDDASLIALYNAVDLMVIPSRQDNLPNTGLESHACGTPVVAFNVGGMADIVDHRRTGYLAEPFKIGDLANGIKWILEDQDRHAGLCREARKRAERKWAYDIVSEKYIAVYREVVEVAS